MNRSREMAAAIAEDALTLAILHDRELDAKSVAVLRDVGFPDNLGLLPEEGAGKGAWRLARLALEALPETMGAAELDDLAADFAAIYLTGACGASPCESVWLDDDHLAFQGRMFDLGQTYREHGLVNPDRRHRPDDHLALQLEFIAHLLKKAYTDEDWHHLARHLDEHLLRWLPDFAQRVVHGGATVFYAGLAAVTATWCRRLRTVIAEMLQEPHTEVR
ncbi:MAG: molecular chaperone TorD family protein [Rhodocyclaceae bacterium]|nr:molecular chaperone TorD family protein [Rhodocyclaceae bacterium]